MMKKVIWGNIWKPIEEKSQTNATNVTMHPLGQAIWEPTVEESQTNDATSGIMHNLIQVHCGYIWRDIVEMQPNATTIEIVCSH